MPAHFFKAQIPVMARFLAKSGCVTHAMNHPVHFADLLALFDYIRKSGSMVIELLGFMS